MCPSPLILGVVQFLGFLFQSPLQENCISPVLLWQILSRDHGAINLFCGSKSLDKVHRWTKRTSRKYFRIGVFHGTIGLILFPKGIQIVGFQRQNGCGIRGKRFVTFSRLHPMSYIVRPSNLFFHGFNFLIKDFGR